MLHRKILVQGRGPGGGLGTLDLELGTLNGHAICYCRLFSALTRQPCTRCAKSPDFERHFVLVAIGSFNKHSTRIINPSVFAKAKPPPFGKGRSLTFTQLNSASQYIPPPWEGARGRTWTLNFKPTYNPKY